jgi:hypothetical protein
VRSIRNDADPTPWIERSSCPRLSVLFHQNSYNNMGGIRPQLVLKSKTGD